MRAGRIPGVLQFRMCFRDLFQDLEENNSEFIGFLLGNLEGVQVTANEGPGMTYQMPSIGDQ